jgi:hypothetical protein
MIRLIWILAMTLLLAFTAATIRCQAPTLKKCDHESTRMSRFKEAGFIPIVARNYDGSRIEWTFSDDQGESIGTFTVDKTTTLPMGFAANYKGRLFWAIYSDCDQFVYAIDEMSAEQVKEFRKFNK